MASDAVDLPPYYDLSELPTCPPYSLHPACAEILLSSSLTPHTTTWHYQTKHMKITLEAGRWGLDYPCYGLSGNVKGSVSFSSSQDCVERVTVSLEVLFATSRSGSVSPILSRTFSLYEAGPKDSVRWQEEHRFSITIPSEVTLADKVFPTPPSFSSVSFAASCQISFSIKVCMCWKGSSLRKAETKIITILYLPKSSPKYLPLLYIPRPSTLEFASSSTSCLHLFDRVHTTALKPFWSSSCEHRLRSEPLLFDHSVNVSIPAPNSFTSGDAIPFTISLVFPDQPVLPKLLFPCISVVLYKRVTVWARKRRWKNPEVAQRDWPIAIGHLKYQNEYREGTILFRGFVDAGKAGEEYSWKLDDMIEVQFILRTTVTPPKYLERDIPCFEHDEVIELTTDHYGTLPRELTATGAIPPALGLMKSSEPVESRALSGYPTVDRIC